MRAIVSPVERRIDEILGGARDAGKTVLTPYLCAGHPDNESLEPMLGACEHAGCPMAILGFPHAIAILEGADFALAMNQVIQRGTKVEAILEQVRRARAIGAMSSRFALVAAVSAAMLVRDPIGPVAFMRRAKATGFDGALVVDVPLEEAGPYRAAADDAGLQFPMLVSSASAPQRMADIAMIATGCAILVGRGSNTPTDLPAAAARWRSATQLPLLVGMDAATTSHVRAATEHAHGVIVSGTLARRVAKTSGRQAGESTDAVLHEISAGLAPARTSGGAA